MGLLNPGVDVKYIIDECKTNTHEKHDEKVENLVCHFFYQLQYKETLQRNC